MIKIILFIISMNVAFTLLAQDTTYYENFLDIPDKAQAIKKIVLYVDSVDLYFVRRFYESGTLSKTYYCRSEESISYEGLLTSYDSLGNLQWLENYKDNKLNGELISYWPNGNIKRTDHYDMDELLDGICYDSIGNEVEYYDYEIMPEFPGGRKVLLRYIQTNLEYPEEARRKGIHGTVYIQFVVNTNGELLDPIVVKVACSKERKTSRSPCKILSKAALNVIDKMDFIHWYPGYKNGEKVRVLYTVPVKFKLQ